MPNFFGYNFPFISESSVLPPQFDERLIKNDLKQLLFTGSESRVMRPFYGTNLHRIVFDPDDNNTKIAIKNSIINAIERYEPRVIYKDIRFNSDGQGLLEVVLFVALVNDPSKILDITVELTGSSSDNIYGFNG